MASETDTAMTIAAASKKLTAGEMTALELTQDCFARIKERDGSVHAYLETFDDALEQAKAVDARRAAGEELSPLAGIPLAIKDNILIEGKHCSAASKMLESYVASYDAHVIERLKEDGAIFLGRANMDEFAMGSSTEHSAFGVTKNPIDEERVPGGSSGGSAAAVAYGGALAALGSDTGGSIRQPASFCGVVGLKPTYGSVSRRGLIAMGSSLDQIGPVARSVEDTRILFEAIAGRDDRDSTSLEAPSLEHKEPKRLGVPRALIAEGTDEAVKADFEATLERLSNEGYELVDIELPSVARALSVYYIIMPAEASTNLARFDGVRYGLHENGDDLLGDYMETRGRGFGAEVKRRIMVGTYVLSAGYYDAYYGTATKVRRAITADFERAFSSVDAIVTPTTPSPAFKIGEKADPISMYRADIFTVPANLAGLPALSVPSGTMEVAGKALPLGIQIVTPAWREAAAFSVGAAVERTRA